MLGPPLASDCDLLSEWIILGEPNQIQRNQVYQISYYCPVMGYASAFVEHLLDSQSDSLDPPIAGVSVLVPREIILQSILVYLINKGWRRIALYYETDTTQVDIPAVFESILLPPDFFKNRKLAINVVDSMEVRAEMSFADILASCACKIDGKTSH